MAIFMDNGYGAIYAGPTKEAVLACMKDDGDDVDCGQAFEVPGTINIRAEDEDGEPMEEVLLLEEWYDEFFGAYCIWLRDW